MSSGISQKLHGSRKELLDIGLRNSMLNFRASAKTLAIVDELSETVFDLLYRQEKAMSFLPMGRQKLAALAKTSPSEVVEAHDAATDELLLHELDSLGEWDSAGDEIDESGRARKHTDTRLQTALDEERLFLQLLRIHSEAREFVEEQGVNTLFLALGFLHWYEADSSEMLRKAPLLLLPVTLERSGAKDVFKLKYSGEELMPNLSLIAKLRTDFGIDLAACEFSEEHFTADGSLDAFYAEVREMMSKQPRWKVSTNEATLGFFSFGKFLMFKDLDPKSWPQDQQPDAHPVINRLLGGGFGDQRPAYAEDVNIDSVLQPGEVRFVKDADSSQTEAILEVREGANLVIQGPPGTGKSQTITNIIAELIAQKKTVLFVAEKMVALEVVKRRLDECHLGDAVLELHSHKSTKQSVLKELGRTLEQGRPMTKVGEDDLANLTELQGNLNRYCEAVSAPVGASGMDFVEVLGRYLKLKSSGGVLQTIPFAPMAAWTQADQQKRRELVDELALHLKEMGRPDQSPFWGSKRTYFSPIEQSSANDALQQASTHLAALDAAAKALSIRLMLSQPATLADVAVICRAARRAAEAPRLQGVELSTGDWQLRRDAIRELLDAGQRMSTCKADHGTQLIEAAWEQDLLEVRQNLLAYGGKWWKLLSGRYRAAKARLQGLAQGVLPGSTAEQLTLVDSVLAYQQSQKVYQQHEGLGSALFGAQWQRQQSDWAVLERVSAWVVKLYEDLGNGNVPQGIIAFLAGHTDASGLGETVSDIEGHLAGLDQALLAGLEVISMPDDTAQSFRTLDLPVLGARLQLWQASLGALYHMARLNVLSNEVRQAQLGELLSIALHSETPDQLPAILDFSWYSGLVQKAYAEKPALQQFDRIKHEHQITRFKALDADSLNHAQTFLARQVWEHMPNVNQPGEMAILRAELNKKRRHIPIRQLIDKAGRAIQQIKPVFMMSPMSIANFLPPGKLAFDVVVFDEASQVKAVDAFGAILRGKQVVVVGDTRQMPPSDLFGREVAPDDDDAESTADIESILSLFKAAGSQERYLRWHYRSRHESLIAVSNVEFYEGKLVVFPSAGQHPHAKGVSFDYLPHALYDRGRTRTNKEEAKAVARAVMKHALETPELSLGVAAFSVHQRDLISVEVELLRHETPQAEAFFTAQGSDERYFVKNLENIQGDERDVIFISIGYGRNETGRIAREFGPLNKDGGHRRLNVLITRAKLSMRVFCNFRGDELDIDASAKHGVRALKNFLKYAETGELEVAEETGKATDSPFEDEVIRALRELGYQVEPQVGTAGYFIDLAVRDPEFPGRYVLAVECDGAAYHSSRSARDRDRLRQGVLEGLGWNFHRIWSTDWFRNPQQEVLRTVAAIEVARERIANRRHISVTEVPIDSSHEILRDESVVEADPVVSQPYEKALLSAVTTQVELHQQQLEHLLRMIRTVVDVESPVHSVEVTRRLMVAFGVTRQGSRITAAVEHAISLGIKQRHFLRRGEFLHLVENRPVVIRSRAHWESAERKLEWVAPEELDQALIEIIISGFSMSHEDAISGALRLLGFGRATAKVTASLEERITQLIRDRRIELREGRLVVSVSC